MVSFTLYSVFSLLFEVADKSFKVADRAIHHSCGGTGGVLQKSGVSTGEGKRGRTPGTERLNTTPVGGFGGLPQENF